MGIVHVKSLAGGRHHVQTAKLSVPDGVRPGAYYLIACADHSGRVAEHHEANNCRASKHAGTLPCAKRDADCDGYLPPADCNNGDAAIHPGAADSPDMQFIDSNCDGIDGNAARAVFVSGTGNDTATGTRAHPLRTLAAGVAAARTQHKDVYVAAGDYPETLTIADGVGVYGGYSTSWQRSLANRTVITGKAAPGGDTTAALAENIVDKTTVQFVTLQPVAPTVAGANSYGVRGENSSGLTLEDLTINAAQGVAGGPGTSGTPGAAGGNGVDATGNGGGTGGTGVHVGGSGGSDPGNEAGQPGGHGQTVLPDAFGRAGGPGGPGGDGGADPDTAGGKGNDGDSGTFGTEGAGGVSGNTVSGDSWRTARGGAGGNGSDGHGGGGGGAGGAMSAGIGHGPQVGGGGGGGGGGGSGGGGGKGGQGGGASFGIFLLTSAGAVVSDSSVVAAAGGNGGMGGAGVIGGTGGSFGQGAEPGTSEGAAGADGGSGGAGGHGGGGGGGAGGPSIAILGIDQANAPGTTVAWSSGGNGGSGGIGGGDDGINGTSGGFFA